MPSVQLIVPDGTMSPPFGGSKLFRPAAYLGLSPQALRCRPFRARKSGPSPSTKSEGTPDLPGLTFHHPRAWGGGDARPGQRIDAAVVRLGVKTVGEAAQQMPRYHCFVPPRRKSPSSGAWVSTPPKPGLMKKLSFLKCGGHCRPRIFVARGVFLSPHCEGGARGGGDAQPGQRIAVALARLGAKTTGEAAQKTPENHCSVPPKKAVRVPGLASPPPLTPPSQGGERKRSPRQGSATKPTGTRHSRGLDSSSAHPNPPFTRGGKENAPLARAAQQNRREPGTLAGSTFHQPPLTPPSQGGERKRSPRQGSATKTTETRHSRWRGFSTAQVQAPSSSREGRRGRMSPNFLFGARFFRASRGFAGWRPACGSMRLTRRHWRLLRRLSRCSRRLPERIDNTGRRGHRGIGVQKPSHAIHHPDQLPDRLIPVPGVIERPDHDRRS